MKLDPIKPRRPPAVPAEVRAARGLCTTVATDHRPICALLSTGLRQWQCHIILRSAHSYSPPPLQVKRVPLVIKQIGRSCCAEENLSLLSRQVFEKHRRTVLNLTEPAGTAVS